MHVLWSACFFQSFRNVDTLIVTADILCFRMHAEPKGRNAEMEGERCRDAASPDVSDHRILHDSSLSKLPLLSQVPAPASAPELISIQPGASDHRRERILRTAIRCTRRPQDSGCIGSCVMLCATDASTAGPSKDFLQGQSACSLAATGIYPGHVANDQWHC